MNSIMSGKFFNVMVIDFTSFICHGFAFKREMFRLRQKRLSSTVCLKNIADTVGTILKWVIDYTFKDTSQLTYASLVGITRNIRSHPRWNKSLAKTFSRFQQKYREISLLVILLLYIPNPLCLHQVNLVLGDIYKVEDLWNTRIGLCT